MQASCSYLSLTSHLISYHLLPYIPPHLLSSSALHPTSSPIIFCNPDDSDCFHPHLQCRTLNCLTRTLVSISSPRQHSTSLIVCLRLASQTFLPNVHLSPKNCFPSLELNVSNVPDSIIYPHTSPVIYITLLLHVGGVQFFQLEYAERVQAVDYRGFKYHGPP